MEAGEERKLIPYLREKGSAKKQIFDRIRSE